MAAKQLRRRRDPMACDCLQSSLLDVIGDERKWETQYQIIMALAESGCADSLPLLRELASMPGGSPMTKLAIGDALVRLARRTENDAAPVFEAFSLAATSGPSIAAGAMRAVAMLRLVPDRDVSEKIVALVRELNDSDVRFWTAAASPGWDRDKTAFFLKDCLSDPFEETRVAAALALKGVYQTYNPL